MGTYALFFIIPVIGMMLVAKIFLPNIKYTWAEMGVQAFFTVLVIAGLFFLGGKSQTADSKFVNGHITKLEARKGNCPSGWRSFRDSHCTEYRTRQVYSHTTCSGTGTSKTCTRHYDTEYKYRYPWETRYFAYANYAPYSGDVIEISRVDDQGAKVPPRYAELEVNDPVSKHVNYVNYIKGASDSLFSAEPPLAEDVVLAYPSSKRHFTANRVVVSGVAVDTTQWQEWNKQLMAVNTALQKTQANVIIALTANGNTHFPEMLARAWHAHNINDVIVTLGVNGNDIGWVDVHSWSNNSLVENKIRDGIMAVGNLDNVAINNVIQTSVLDNFELKSMDEFEYLAEEIKPPLFVMIMAFFVLLIATPVITYLFHKHDVF